MRTAEEIAELMDKIGFEQVYDNDYDDYKNAIDKIKEAGIYVIGRIVVFNDSHYGKDHPEDCIKSSVSSRLWPSAYSRGAWEYNVELAKEAVLEFGFNEIQFDYVRFPDRISSYKNIDFKIKANTTFGIVGKTGAGKSTLVHLLTRLYDVNDGEILIDNKNIKDLSLKDLHDNVALISQDVYMFKGTIKDNIAYANENASIEQIISAAKAAHAHEFIMNLENNMYPIIFENIYNKLIKYF